jgi:hypothetical protein
VLRASGRGSPIYRPSQRGVEDLDEAVAPHDDPGVRGDAAEPFGQRAPLRHVEADEVVITEPVDGRHGATAREVRLRGIEPEGRRAELALDEGGLAGGGLVHADCDVRLSPRQVVHARVGQDVDD